MVLPLYRCSIPMLGAKGNTGLWYDKFCDKWDDDWNKGLIDGGKQDWIKTVLKGKIGDMAVLREIEVRRNALHSAIGGVALFFKTKGPFVTGLGRNHPVENGFAWHHTLGVPYLPGSSIKGVVRAWAASWLSKPEDDINRIFGPRDSKDQSAKDHSVGSVIFLDALPIKPVQLKADIITPHYGHYYQDDEGKTPPADWYSPIPVAFLAVDSNQEFVFGLMPRRPDNPDDVDDCSNANGWLVDALKNLGGGAKTAVGYGRFENFVPR